MSHRKDDHQAEILCADSGGFAHFHGGAKTSLKAECVDGTSFYMSDGAMVQPMSDGEVVLMGALIIAIVVSFVVCLFKA